MATTDQYVINFTDPANGSFIVSPYTSNGRKFPISSALDSTAISASSSMLLYGKGSGDYGERIQENEIHILESFSGPTAPLLPISGQLWFSRRDYWYGSTGFFKWDDTLETWGSILSVSPTQAGAPPPASLLTDGQYSLDNTGAAERFYRGVINANNPMNNLWVEVDFTGDGTADPVDTEDFPEKILKVFDGTNWVRADSAFASDTAPTSPSAGDLWFDTGTANQLKVWNGAIWFATSGNYVQKTGDSMSGDLIFVDGIGIRSDVIAGSPLVGGTFLVAGSGAYFEATGTGAISLSAANKRIINVATPTVSTDAVNKTYADGLFGAVGTTLDGLADVTITSAVVNQVISFSGVGSPEQQWTNVALTADNVTVTQTTGYSPPGNISAINVQDALEELDAEKLSLADGGTLSGPLVLYSLYTPTNPFDATTKQYVDSVSAADGVLDTAVFDPGTLVLTLTTSAPASQTFNVFLDHSHDSIDVSHIPGSAILRDELGFDFFAGSPIVTTIPANNAFERIADNVRDLYSAAVDTQNVFQQIFRPSIDTTDFVLDPNGAFTAGYNRLNVYVNGVKQYGDERGFQGIKLLDGVNISASSTTGLSGGTSYTMDVVVDGAAAQTLTVTGSQVETVQAIVDQINSQITGIVSVYDKRSNQILIYSDTVGNLSEIGITDIDLISTLAAQTETTYAITVVNVSGDTFTVSGDQSGVFVAGFKFTVAGSTGNDGTYTVTGTSGVGSPITATEISVNEDVLDATADGSISSTLTALPITDGDFFPATTAQITIDNAYYEVVGGSPFVAAAFGEPATGVVFNAAVLSGSVVEFLTS